MAGGAMGSGASFWLGTTFGFAAAIWLAWNYTRTERQTRTERRIDARTINHLERENDLLGDENDLLRSGIADRDRAIKAIANSNTRHVRRTNG